MDIVESVQYGDYPLCLIGRFLLNFDFFFCLIVCNFFVWQIMLNVQYGVVSP